MPEHPFRTVEFDGLVVEDAQGNRVLAIPAAVLPILRSANVIRFRLGDAHFSMRLDSFADRQRTQATQARDELTPKTEPREPAGSAPTRDYGAPALGVQGERDPSPAPPPAPEEEAEDPANIPLRARRGGEWVNVYVTRAQYDQYVAEGRISPELPEQEGTEQ